MLVEIPEERIEIEKLYQDLGVKLLIIKFIIAVFDNNRMIQ